MPNEDINNIQTLASVVEMFCNPFSHCSTSKVQWKQAAVFQSPKHIQFYPTWKSFVLLSLWNYLGNNTKVGSHSLLQGNLPDPGIEPPSPALKADFLPPEPPGKWVQSLGWEDPLEKGMATHSSILSWRIPWTEKPGGLQSMELQSQTQLKWQHAYMPWDSTC